MAGSDRVNLLQERIRAALSPAALEIVDDSHRHAGHEGAKSGGGHYNVRIVSEAFRGKALLERHRLVYAAVGDAMNREVHALSIQAQTPEEAAAG
ncbi:MAG: BolA family transcriptional regulator [Chromatiales bacterium 21-64-14]|nr:MAG: BolA family transcriptional regulator [Chromatiales bacterium 21-64-14]HQU15353.1 BolA family protein [Gammaproteobacteria bacterium]